MIQIAVPTERRVGETRVAITPSTVKQFQQLGCAVVIESGAGKSSAITDEAFIAAGATIVDSAAQCLQDADIVLKVSPPLIDEHYDETALFTSGQLLVAQMHVWRYPQVLHRLVKRGVSVAAMEYLPRISRAQSMDVLSSQANLGGYVAVLEAARLLPRAMPMMMTAAGTIPPAKVFVMGAGVAGLQAIATARRLGAVVSATDVRPATKEQVESLGATFVAVENEEFQQAQTDRGYAKEMSDEYKAAQATLIANTVAKQDIIVTTALIPGKPAPQLISEQMVQTMKPGAVIVDMAAESGGNCALTKVGEVVSQHNVTIVGYANYPALIPETASQLYANNILHFLQLLLVRDNDTRIVINRDDAVIDATVIAEQGNIVNETMQTIVASVNDV